MNKKELLELIKGVIEEDIEFSKKEGLEIYLTNGTILKLFQYTQSYLYHNKKDEMFVIKEVKRIMEDVTDVVKSIPMISEPEMSETNWAEKKEYIINE